MVKQLLFLLAVLLLSACGTTKDSRYRDNARLERPPEIPVDQQAAEQRAVNELEPQKRRHKKGLGSDIYKVEGSSRELGIKRGYDESWSLLGRAILLKDLKVADQDRSKGTYYVVYDGGSIFGGYSPFSDESKSTYLLKVDSQGDETKVAVSFANKEDQTDSIKINSNDPDRPEDLSERLSDLLYETLHDDVKDDSDF